MTDAYETMALTTFALALVSALTLGLTFVSPLASIGLTSYFLVIMCHCADKIRQANTLRNMGRI